MKRLFAFAAVGAVGFMVDAAVLTALTQIIAMNVVIARLISFALATVVTWALNRNLVFRVAPRASPGNRSEYLRYLLVQTIGAAVNLTVFLVVVRAIPELVTTPVVPLAIGAMFAMAFNYFASRSWVFKSLSGNGQQ